MAVMKMCDCAKPYRLALNFSMNPGLGYLPQPSLEISAKSDESWVGIPSPTFPRNFGQITRVVFWI